MNKEKFYQLIDKYLAGKASLEEEQLLLNFIESFQEDISWDERVMGVREELEEKMLARLMAAVKAEKNKGGAKVRSIRIWKNIAASIILAAIGIGLYAWFQQKKLPQAVEKAANSLYKNDLAPGGNKAVLTLADGSVIVLNEAGNGTIARQGNTMINKTSEGKLAYLSEGGKAGTPQMNTISTPAGGQYQITLPDGTRVWLNAASSLKFPAAFTGTERLVELSGEAYFEAAKKEVKGRRIPFIVMAGGQQVEVLGTHFNIMAYPDEDISETTLLEGSVRVSRQFSKGSTASGNSRILSPGQQAKFSSTSTGIRVLSNVNTESVLAWKSGIFLFESTPIEKVMQQVKRWYNAEIIYAGVRPEVEFTGIVPRSSHASNLLNVLESAGGVKFKIEGNKIIVQKSNH